MGIYEELEWRGLIKDVSDPSLREKLNKGGMTFYIGTDPTGDSLHIGHYSSLLTAKRLMKYGHHPILLVGGATGLIGDPRPTAEREIIDKKVVENNIEGIKKQVKLGIIGEEKFYPYNYFWNIAKDYKIDVILGADVHDPDDFLAEHDKYGYDIIYKYHLHLVQKLYI